MSLYCPHCFCQNSDDASFCLRCGGAMRIQNRKNQLPAMSILAGRYLIGKVLGEGGFGITYAGYDLRLEKMVAVKEYFPTGLATRYDTHAHTVEAVAPMAEEALNRGKEKFLIEARTMSHFSKLPTVVDVLDFFNANGTAYIVMEYLDGISMGQYLKQHGPERDFNRLYAMLSPVLRDLEKIHQAGLIHRDISPSNLMLLEDGTVKLLDFGTAREMSEEGEKSMSVVLKHGFAPAEQYSRRGQQGAWTDIYALCATMYKLLTGITPESAMDRQEEDRLTPPSQLGVRISRRQEQTLLQGLAVRRSERIRSMAELMTGFEGKVTAAQAVSAPTSKATPRRDTPSAEKKKPKHGLVWGLCALAVASIAVFVAIQMIVPNMKYKDAVVPMETAAVGELVTFGTYKQDNTSNGAEAIQWRVLAKEENRILVISEYALEARPYNEDWVDITWETCALRSWLNNVFYNTAFTAAEQAMIPTTAVKAQKNPIYSTDPGKDTQDKVFLLSIQEAEQYFSSDEARKCAPTAYAKAQGADTNKNTCIWWLRSPGLSQHWAAGIDYFGGVHEYGYYVLYGTRCVRPALWIDLDA